MRSLNAFILAALLAAPAAAFGVLSSVAFAYEAGEVKDGGTIIGKVKFTGSPPSPKFTRVGQDRDVCGKTQKIYGVEVKDGGLENAVVKIVEIKKGKKFDFPEAVLDQKECVFVPRIVLMSPGKLTILNSDGIPHNVNTISKENEPFNVTMSKLERKTSVSLQSPEFISFKCDLHGWWMRGLIVVAEHPYHTVTGDGGSFELRDVPPGTYMLEVWHAELGKEQQKVTVEAGKTTEVELTY